MSEDREFIVVEAGEKIEIFSRRFSSVPLTVEFGAATINKKQLQGNIEIESSILWFQQPAKITQLKNFNQINVSMWNTFLKIYVKPECDIEISLPIRHFKSPYFVYVLIGAVMIFALSLLLFS